MFLCSQPVKVGGLAFAAAFFVVFSAFTPVMAQNPCKSEDPLDADEAFRRADCGESDSEGWGTYQYDREMDRIPDEGPSVGETSSSANYNHLPTTFSAWFDSLSPAEKDQLARVLAEETGVRGRSARELEAITTLVGGEIDAAFNSEGLSARQRRMAIVEIATGAGLDVEPKRGSGYEYEDFGRGDYGDRYEGWERIDPTEDFGRPESDTPKSDADWLDEF